MDLALSAVQSTSCRLLARYEIFTPLLINFTCIILFLFVLRCFLLRCIECIARRSSQEKAAVCLSVCLSNVCIVTKGKKICPDFFLSDESSLSLVFWEEEWLVGAIPSSWSCFLTVSVELYELMNLWTYLKFWINRPRWSEVADFHSIFTCSASAVAFSKNVQLTLIESRLRAFCWT